MTPLRRRLNTLVGLLILGGLAWLYHPLLTGESRVRAFCESLTPGSSLGEVRAAARKLDFGITEHADDALIHEASSFGRFICQVKFHDGKLLTSVYVHND